MDPVVTTSLGKIRGTREEHVTVFRGIRFAAPPLGPRRFQAPARPAARADILDATRFGAQAMQNANALGMMGFDEAPMDEDCLFLNVWTPATDGARRPVMVWIHGGAFVIGAGSQLLYDGAALARRGDVVIVTINYRLGVFGFLRHPPGTGNEGLLDQIAALEWVRDEIAAFGGDPGNVTIFGESAGAMSVATLLATPRARGLFHRAIVQSGAANVVLSRARADGIAARVREKLDLPADDGAALATLPATRLLQAQRSIFERSFRGNEGLAFAPVVDGDILPRHPTECIEASEGSPVPLLIGTTLEEMKLFSMMDPEGRSMDEALLRARLEQRIPGRTDAVLRVYREGRAARGLACTPSELWCAIETDRFFRAPAMALAAAHRRRVPQTFTYLFDWRSPLLGGAFGACHALELPFVFGTHDRGPIGMFVGAGPEADALAEHMQDAWLAFARSSDPSTPALGTWPSYDTATRATMILGPDCRVERAPFEAERRFWDAA